MKNNRTPFYLLERINIGELKEESQTLNEKDKLTIKEIKKSDKEILEQYSPRVMVAGIKEKYEKAMEQKNLWSKLSEGLLLNFRQFRYSGAVALTILVLVSFPIIYKISVSGGENRLKGATPYINIYKLENSGILKLKKEDKVKADDIVQISYVPMGYAYGLIFSLDGNNNITLHLPEIGDDSYRMTDTGEKTLPNSVKLDNAKGYERFYFVSSNDKFSVSLLIEKIKLLIKNSKNIDSESLGDDNAYSVSVFNLNK